MVCLFARAGLLVLPRPQMHLMRIGGISRPDTDAKQLSANGSPSSCMYHRQFTYIVPVSPGSSKRTTPPLLSPTCRYQEALYVLEIIRTVWLPETRQTNPEIQPACTGRNGGQWVISS